ncbi:acetyl/propionyl/methylcrotonyl-CoA carboxylase subunit alpha [Chitinivorax tropicus]|uniref:acetyl/propionyl/methylcrotonyl-CoA carboxylase subunit alpha n=1 Tax=Chitinivorax tropicus TaxID=714531 RepID=UPI003CCCC154
MIANRGEIACRLIATAHQLGYHTIAVFSDADQHARHVRLADEAVRLGPPAVGESYLSIPRLLAACQQSGAEAVHPGYGFLSENALFAQAILAAGLVWVGPSPAAMQLMGNKRQAKLAMLAAGVPCVPGYAGEDQSDRALAQAASEIGYPLMIKAVAGGGGRGMRLVNQPMALEDAVHRARSEARHAFGSDELILEKAVVHPRHVEFQILADTHGQVLHLGERECSVQRRHQKVIEESPCPVMTHALRERMGAAAVAAASACGYVGAGTVEFLLGADQQFYFLEMNTRLQVEHPVTELVTGLDLVAWQLRVAQGERLPWQQSDMTPRGHAIEVRLYAEDPAQGFLPQTGPVIHWRVPSSIRIDHGIQTGDQITPFYDPMLAKLITHGDTRADAVRAMARALSQTTLLGVVHNQRFLQELIDHPAFMAGETHTGFIDQYQADLPSLSAQCIDFDSLALAAALLQQVHSQRVGDWGRQQLGEQPRVLRVGERTHEVIVETAGAALTVSDAQLPGQAQTLVLLQTDAHHCEYLQGVRRLKAAFAMLHGQLLLQTCSGAWQVADVTHAPPIRQTGAGSGIVLAPMDGAIVDVRVQTGDRVEAGQLLMVLEAMKMEHRLTADCAGIVNTLLAGKGQQVKRRQQLAIIGS